MIDSRPTSETNTLASHENAARSRGSETAHAQAKSPGRSFRRFRFSEKCVFPERTQVVIENKGLHYGITGFNPIDFHARQNYVLPLEPNKSLKTNGRSWDPLGFHHPRRRKGSRRRTVAAGTPKPMHENAQRSALPARLRVVSRRADKYRVKCALPFSSVLIRFHPWPTLLSLRVSQ